MNKDIELNPIKRMWIRTWYNDWVRMFVILFPSYMIGLIPVLLILNLPKEVTGYIISIVYFGLILLSVHYNDYTNLNRIGLDVYGHKLNDD